MGEVIFKEITPYPEVADRWKDLAINAGASQSTLQDIKLPETAGCYTYKESDKLSEVSGNRFIYWRTSNDVIELVEISLDVDLRGNHLRLRFQHTPILQGLSIHETHDQVVILIATVSTIHKLRFPHPKKLQGRDHYLQKARIIMPSIFFDTSGANLRDQSTYFILNHASVGIPLPHTSCCWLTSEGDAAFVLANNAGSHLLVVMSDKDGGNIITTELKRTSVMSRLWSGLVRGSQSGDVALSVVCHQDATDVYIFSLGRDLRIRMWSQNKQECLMIASVFEHYGENGNTAAWNFTAQQCCLKKSVGNTSSEYYLGVYITLPQQNQFCIFQPIYVGDQYRLSHIATLYHSQYDLVDFCLSSSHVWTLWLNSDSEPVIKLTSIESDEKSVSHIDWLSVDLQPPVSRDVYIPFGVLDPREAYLKEIFQQGRFSPSTISKAISIYRRTMDTSFSCDSTQGIEAFKDKAIKAVENEILAKASESDLTDEEYQELQIECWDRFFSYCIQYHVVGTKPLGLSLDPATGYVIIIKKSIYSILRPCDPFEQLIFPSVNISSSASFCMNPFLKEDVSLGSSILAVMHCLNILRKHLNEDMIIAFDHNLFHLQSPDEIASELAKELSVSQGDSDGTLLLQLQLQIQVATNIVPALRFLLRKIDMSPEEDEVSEMEDMDAPQHVKYRNFMSSTAGISLLCEGVSQLVSQRYSFCRDLLLLEMLIIQLGEMSGVTLENAEKIRSEIIPVTRIFVQAYYTLKWCTQCECVPVQTSLLETGLRQLSLLDIPESPSSAKCKTGSAIGKTIVYLFLVEQGRNDAYGLINSNISSKKLQKNWKSFFPLLTLNVVKLLWPLGPFFCFPEFLLAHSQYLPLQGYIRLLQKWCDFNCFSRQFLAANCFLILGEHWKALQLFTQVANGVDREDFLSNKIMHDIDSSTISSTAQYYMKVIQLFEHFDLSDCILNLATTVIGILAKTDPHIPIFWSLVFKHHLELGHSEEAYTAMTRNPDPSRQKDCLRQLMVVLCERRQLRTLVEFPYLNMQDDVVSILESRARSSDLLRQNYYDLLYAFHIQTNNFRKAASIMFEYGMRLGQEVNNVEGLQKQASCYLATINSLHLVDPQYAWIVKPVPKVSQLSEDSENESSVNMSPKRNSDGEEIQNSGAHKKIEVLELSDIRHEYDLIHARLLLVQRDQSPTNMAATPLSASDTLALLINAGLFDVAIGLCKSFSLPFSPVFEGLTYRCINLMQQSKNQWLKEDELELFDWLGQNDSSILPSSGYISGHEQVWYLLKCYLEQYEEKGQTLFHRCVSSKLLSAGVQLPAWLKRSYQNRNCAELLWLYISYGLLENATDLAVDYIDAILGHGKQDFGLKYSLHASSPPVWLPHTYLDALLEALEEVQNEAYCTELYKRLTEKLQKYNHTVASVSENMIIMSNS